MNTEIEITVQGWNYKSWLEKDGLKFILTPKSDDFKETPKLLCKFYSLEEYNIDALLNSYFYASHPDDLNDPFDCDPDLIRIDNMSILESFFIGDYYFIFEALRDQYGNNEATILKNSPRIVRELIFQNLGILSMIPPQEKNDILMWTHYSKHTGYFVEYDFNFFPQNFYGPFQINYQAELKPTSILSSQQIGSLALMQSNLKYNKWHYENEWRFLIWSEDMLISTTYPHLGGQKRKFNYPINAISSITLGEKFIEVTDLVPKLTTENELHVKLESTNFTRKLAILDFIHTNRIELLLLHRDNFKLKPIRYSIEKMETSYFKLTKTE